MNFLVKVCFFNKLWCFVNGPLRKPAQYRPMARTALHPARTALLPAGLVDVIKRRIVKFSGLALIILALFWLVALFSYHHADPSLNSATNNPARNLLGLAGAYTADLLFQVHGAAGALPSLVFAAWGWRLMSKKGVSLLWLRLLFLLAGVILISLALAVFSTPESWPLRTGLGGVAGAVLLNMLTDLLVPLVTFLAANGMADVWFDAMIAIPAALLGTLALIFSGGLDRAEWRAMWQGIRLTGSAVGFTARFVGQQAKSIRTRIEPTFGNSGDNHPDEEYAEEPADDPIEQALQQRSAQKELKARLLQKRKNKTVVTDKAKKAPVGKRTAATKQGNLKLTPSDAYQLPPLEILEEPPEITTNEKANKESLAQNAQLLESVLEDFGVKGEIVKVRPGPVVTLYELEPAPGTKTSRVIGLSDDIARSMSALSVRIAVVPGRSVIGIELPNAKRDTVFFRELLASNVFDKSSSNLTLVLGKDIGGAPLVADLARMLHLLIAGTTGSGKSVAINTMILSLLYRLSPDQCKFIMIDPKMLELSVYEGIPNLLAPVVTDPSKAIVALKWAVREMEDRYRLMSQMGVRNITGYNARLAEARKKGDALTRRVQTSFDESGKPVYENQPLSMDPLPMIVVVVDEMADLMMVAGKDIEAAIQRLAQMARAAGIHLIMATQRPSVDVITGTIKANFPTRISFQVTSKIDSRTILGEQGAEQLLGQGDMLYMPGGGQIARVHSPFVSDEEVEHVVSFLKSQGEPDYVDAVTEDDDNGFSAPGMAGKDDGDELYDEAVAIIAREGKASTSFIQRHLQIGYNRAARIIEKMEAEGVVSKADRVGRREVLVGAH